mmetsp:Transcript_10829/g.35587  ORF Transcript_10829/g.35587 Transcript_10829/m.35587 type:complete len:89 (+) Transcript_10829:164-430(+)
MLEVGVKKDKLLLLEESMTVEGELEVGHDVLEETFRALVDIETQHLLHGACQPNDAAGSGLAKQEQMKDIFCSSTAVHGAEAKILHLS